MAKSFWDLFKKDPGSGSVVIGQGQGKKSENKRLMDDIMNPNTNGGAGKGPNNAGGQQKKKKEEAY